MSILNTLREENNFNREEIIVAMEAMMDSILNEVAMDSAIESTDFYADPCVSIGKSYLGAMEAISEDKAEQVSLKIDNLEEELAKAKKEKDPKRKWKIAKMVFGAILAIAATIGAVKITKKFKAMDAQMKAMDAGLRGVIHHANANSNMIGQTREDLKNLNTKVNNNQKTAMASVRDAEGRVDSFVGTVGNAITVLRGELTTALNQNKDTGETKE